MMIDKDFFTQVIDGMKSLADYQNEKNKVYRKFGADGYLMEPNMNVEIIRLLSLFFGEGAVDVLTSYCIENKFAHGKGNKEYTDKHGKTIKLSSPEKLYDYLISLPTPADSTSTSAPHEELSTVNYSAPDEQSAELDEAGEVD